MSIGIALVGCGEVGKEKHLPALLGLADARLCAFHDRDPEKARSLAASVPGARAEPDLDTLLADPRIELVGILTPPAEHVELALRALRAGKRVLIEKPLALRFADGERLAPFADRVTVGFHMRCHRLVLQLKELLRRRSIGSVQGVRFAWCSPRPHRPSDWKDSRATGGGSLIELGVHSFDLIPHLLGGPFRRVVAGSVSGRRQDETASVLGTLANGVTCAATFSEVATHQIELEIYGTDGRIHLDLLRFDGLRVMRWGVDPARPWARLRSAWNTLRQLPRLRPGGDYLLSYREQWRQAIHGHPVCSWQEGMEATRVVEAALRSLESGQAVEL